MLVSAGMSDPSVSIQKMTRNPFTEGPEGSLYNPGSFAGGELVSVQKVGASTFTLAFSRYWASGTPGVGGYQSVSSSSDSVLLRVDARSGASVVCPPAVPNTDFASGESRFEVTQKALVSGTTDDRFHFLAYDCLGSDGKKYVMIAAYLSTEGGTYFNLSRFFSTEGLKGSLTDCTHRGGSLLFTFTDGESLQFVQIPLIDLFANGGALLTKRDIWGTSGWGIESEPHSLSIEEHESVASFQYRNRLVMLVSPGGDKTQVYTFDEGTKKLKKKTELSGVKGRAHPALVSQGSSIPVSYVDESTNTTPFKLFTEWGTLSYDTISV